MIPCSECGKGIHYHGYCSCCVRKILNDCKKMSERLETTEARVKAAEFAMLQTKRELEKTNKDFYALYNDARAITNARLQAERERDWLARLCGQMVAPKDEEAQKRFTAKFLEEATSATQVNGEQK